VPAGTVVVTVCVVAGAVDVTVVTEDEAVVEDTAGVGGPEYVNCATPTSVVVLARVSDAVTVYVPGTHSK
jgi:hypothetical protein